jgi:hypothetical protein
METARIRKVLQAYDVWVPVAFTAARGLIALVAHFYTALRTNASPTAWDSSLGVYFCFLPMAFWYTAVSHRNMREQVKALEARIQQLEAGKAAS